MENLLIIDADGHVNEPNEAIKQRMSERYRDSSSGPRDSWDRSLGGTLGQQTEGPAIQLQDMDVEGIDIQVIFPTKHLGTHAVEDVGLAVDRAHAYNEWLAEFCSANPARLKGVAQIALQDVDAAIKEARWAVDELGFVAVMMPTHVLDQDIGKPQFWRFYEEIQALGAPLAVHGGITPGGRMSGRFDTFISLHTVDFPFECMAAVTGLVFAGVPEAFPQLKFAILEGCCGWLPFLMDRMDEEFELRGSHEAPLLKRKPSEYLASSQFSYGFEIEESMLPYVINRIGADKLLFASDYPHWDTSWPHSVEKFLSRGDVSEAEKRQILGENPQRLYGFTVEAPLATG